MLLNAKAEASCVYSRNNNAMQNICHKLQNFFSAIHIHPHWRDILNDVLSPTNQKETNILVQSIGKGWTAFQIQFPL